MNKRSSDATSTLRFRADRFFSAQGAWYCDTREGISLGPFVDRQAANSGLRDYLDDLKARDQDVRERATG
jgi:hypothetical protein